MIKSSVALSLVRRFLFLGLLASALAAEGPSFSFADTPYFHRWSQDDQHEFTPAGQEDLEKWSDMLTANGYPEVHDGEALAKIANSVLENYKSHGAMVLKTSSVPRTEKRAAEHFIAVVFGRPQFIEIAFARLKLENNTGASYVYSHRIYGEKIGDQVSAWLKAHGPEMEKALLEWQTPPAPAILRKELRQTKT